MADNVDNIEVEELPLDINAAEAPDQKDDVDKYMELFDQYVLHNAKMDKVCDTIDTIARDSDKVGHLVYAVKELKEQNKLLYQLLVQMNNFFSTK